LLFMKKLLLILFSFVIVFGIVSLAYRRTFKLNDSRSVANKGIAETTFSHKTASVVLPGDIDIEHIRRQLKKLGYSEHAWPGIERELSVFLNQIDISRLKNEAARIKSDPVQYKDFVSKIGEATERGLSASNPYASPLLKQLAIGLGDGDISRALETAPTNQEKKEEFRQTLVACSAIAQLGSIILDLLDFNVKAVFTTGHVFNCISLDDRHVIFTDFSTHTFEMIDIDQYYKRAGRYWVLKEAWRISPEKTREITEQWIKKGLRPDSLKGMLNSIYSTIYITDDYSATPGICLVHGGIYIENGNFDQAITGYTKAIKISPQYADAYGCRANAYYTKGSFDKALADYNRVIEISPQDANAYSNRAAVYYNQGNFDQAIADYTKAIAIDPHDPEVYRNRANIYYTRGIFDQAIVDYTRVIEIKPDDAGAYYGRGCAYSGYGNFDQVIVDCNKAIEINPQEAIFYHGRGLCYFFKKVYDKSWEDVHRAEQMGYTVDPQFVAELKKVSGREK
jgi:tetratricopeptide (TPR) repeat protein